MAIEFTRTADPPGLEVFDSNEQRRLHVRTRTDVHPETVSTDGFYFPVDRACRIEASSLRFDQCNLPDIHDVNGRAAHSLDVGERYEISDRDQFVGLTGPIKLYCQVTSGAVLETGIDSVELSFDEPMPVVVGARSLHEKPIGTIRVPDDPSAMMEAVTALSSALKTTSVERSWPTLRGHPPLIERGRRLDVPDGIVPKRTDVTIEVQPTYRDVYAVSPLAFYLGASVEPGAEPRLDAGGTVFEFGVDRRLEDDVARTLKRVLLLDCVVRTQGVYQYELYERNELVERLPFALEAVYDRPLSARLERYMEVPYADLEPYVPTWPLTAHVPSTPAGIEIVPFVVNELGVVREPRGRPIADGATATTAIDDVRFVRSAERRRSPTLTPTDGTYQPDYVEPDVCDESIEHAWFGSDVPRGASKATIEAFRNQLSRRERSETIEILVVCNDARMLDEHDVLDETYGNREALPFDVTSEFGVATETLASLLTDGGYDFLHYIGHATTSGLRCSDGELDVRSLPSVDVGVFFLNACESYTQGLELAKRGAFGGIVTLSEVVNQHAVEIGETVARLLNLGFPLRAALALTRETTDHGDQYLIVGDGSADIAQSSGCAPLINVLDETNRRDVTFSIRTFPTKEFKVGTTTTPSLDCVHEYQLTPGAGPSHTVPADALQTNSLLLPFPYLVDGRLEWSNRFDHVPVF